ncbi:Tgt2/MlaC family protein [Paraflavitalea devenefica]|uniref:Tgt2/MlaC family protein n=1 Tax=Paraflavitalea devenefica TaxID=2716334 RepID=UPI001ABB98BE|nr:ABC transporter substrate-binding protein [Paraflavitalea devenefica]
MLSAKSFLLLTLLSTSLLTVQGQSKASGEVLTPIKKLVVQVRTSKDAQALKQLDMESISRYLLADYHAKATPQQLSEFASLFQALFSKIAFPRIRENFKDLASIIYETPEVNGHEATVASMVVIDNPVKKQELKLIYTMVKTSKGWKVKDVAVLGGSMLTGIRDDQVRPLLDAGGIDHLLQEMRKLKDQQR